MCIIFLYLNDNPEQCPYRLIVANNRDEYLDRPTDTAAFRGDNQQWIAGLDLQQGKEGGTWIGMSKSGKFAVLLNILSKQMPDKKGRGHWVPDFLQSNISSEEYIQTVTDGMDQCNAFQFLCTDLRETPSCIHYVSNRDTSHLPRRLSTGIHGFDNSSDFDRKWQKTVVGKEKFAKIVSSCGSVAEKHRLVINLIDLLSDKTQHIPDSQLARQFEESDRKALVDTDVMKQKSAINVWMTNGNYTTRTNTVILVDFAGNCDYYERTLETPVDWDNPKYTTVSYFFKLELGTSV